MLDRVTRQEGELVALDKEGPDRAPEGMQHTTAILFRSANGEETSHLPADGDADGKRSHLHAKSP